VEADAQREVIDDIERRLMHPFSRRSRSGRRSLGDGSPFEQQRRALAAVAADLGVVLPAPTGEQRARADIASYAHAAGLILRPVTLPVDWWRQDYGPLVGTCDGKAVALIRRGRRYRLHQATDQTRTKGIRVNRAVAGRVLPTATAVTPQLPPEIGSPWQIARFGLRGNVRWLVLATCMSIVAGLVSMLTPLGTRAIWDVAVPRADRVLLAGILAFLLSAALASMALKVIAEFASLRVGARFDSFVRPAVWFRMQRIRNDYFRQHPIGQIAQQANLVPKVFGLTLAPIFALVGLVAFGAPALAMMLFLSPQLTRLVLLAAVVQLVVAALISWRTAVVLQRQLPVASEITSVTHDLLAGVLALRVSGAEAYGMAQWADPYGRNQHLTVHMRRLAVAGAVFGMLWPLVVTSAVYYVVGTDLLSTITVGTYVAFLSAYGFFHHALGQIPRTIAVFFTLSRFWRRCQPLFVAPLERTGPTRDPGRLGGAVDLTAVTVRHGLGPAALDDVDLHIAPGEYVGITGPTGAGKSTLVRLLLGFEVPSAGTVAYDSIDFAELDIDLVRAQLGVVTQGMRPIGDTVREVVAGVRDFSDEAIWAALESVGLADEVRSLPMGLDTSIGSGGEAFSGGQVQALLLARALIGSPALMILDEATSALDDLTQQAVASTLAALDMTRIVVAHRLSSIAAADRIVVVDGGKVVQQGTFAELTQSDGLFRDLEKEGSASVLTPAPGNQNDR
jgi:ATP-binding cassette subfamily C protein